MHSEDVTQVIASNRYGGLSLLGDKVRLLSGLELASVEKSGIRCLGIAYIPWRYSESRSYSMNEIILGD